MAIKYISFLLFSFLLTGILLAALRKFSLKNKVFISRDNIPYIGGVGIFLSFIFSYLSLVFISGIRIPFEIIIVLVFSSVLTIIELIDDMKDFSLKARVVIQIIFTFFYFLYAKKVQIYFLPSWVNYLISFLWIMGITNAFNLLDISDGLCGGIALIVSLSFLAVSFVKGDVILSGLFLILSGALLLFVIFNFPPAKIFMGNSGSHLIGFLFASLSIYGDYATLDNKIALITPLLILFFPIMDTLILIIIRLRKGIVPLRKSDDHIFLRLLDAGYTPRVALFRVYLAALLWAVSGIAVVFGLNPVFIVFITIAPLYTLKIALDARSVHQY